MVLVGSVICVLAFVLAGRFVLRRLAGVEQAQMGFTTLVTLVLFMGGVQLAVDRAARRIPRAHLRRSQGAPAVHRPAPLSRSHRAGRSAAGRRPARGAMTSGVDSASVARLARMAAVAALLALYYVMAVSAASQKSMTFDEMAHLTGGYTYWAFNDYRLHPENGNWPQRLGALPAVLGGASFPRLDQPAWTTSNVYAIGDQFLYSSGNDAGTVLAAWPRGDGAARRGTRRARLRVGQTARVASRGMGGLLLFVILARRCWRTAARHVGHGRGAVLHGGSWCDVGGAAPGDADHRPRWRGARWPAAFLSKLSGPILIPVGIVMLAVRDRSAAGLSSSRSGAARSNTPVARGSWPSCSASPRSSASSSWALIWASFGFRYTRIRRWNNGQGRVPRPGDGSAGPGWLVASRPRVDSTCCPRRTSTAPA